MPNMPGAAVMTDTLDFVKNLWGSMGVVPGITAPTLSVDDLEKKINDLKAVEAWLNLNTSMVRGTIQALEVQRNTIATLKSMGQTLATAMQQPEAGKEKSLFDSIPYASAFFQQAADSLQPGAAAKAAASAAPTAAPSVAPAAPPPAAAPAAGAEAGAMPDLASAAPVVTAWWNMLQDQFKQAVSTAMVPDAAAKFSAAVTQPPSRPAADEQAPAGDDNGKNGAAKRSAGEASGTGSTSARKPVKRAPAKAEK
jgi:hypothetical protein